ncbi:MAG: M3 family metallopeptidase [bacterium]
MKIQPVLIALVAGGLCLAGCKKQRSKPGTSGGPAMGAATLDPEAMRPMGAADGMDAMGAGATDPTRPKVWKGAPKGVLAAPVVWDSEAEVNKGCGDHLAAAEKLKTQVESVTGAQTLKNTLGPYNGILIEVDRILPMSELVSNTHPQKPVRTAAEKCEQRVKKFVSKLMLNRKLYDALKGVDTKGLDRRAQRFVRLLLRDYRRAGVDRDGKTRKKLAALDAQMVKLGQTFQRTIREDKRFLDVTEKDLEGLPADYIEARKKKMKAGRVRITTDYPDFFPLQAYAKSEALRRKLYYKYLRRGFPKNAQILKQLLVARHTYATLLGFPDWAEYNAEDKMVKKKQVVADFIDKVTGLARPRMTTDLTEILARKKKDHPQATGVGAWDRFYYVKKIQSERFGVKPAEVRAYFDFAKVKKGLLELAQELWQVAFKRVPKAKVWHPSVEAYDVYDQGQLIARFYLDLHPRKGKYGHAAEFPIHTGILGKQLPSASLVTNFPDPSKTGGGPALTEHHQVTTFFHEFGHLMHKLLAGKHRWATQSGITCEWDFVEAPSQIMEEWAWDATILARFARHHKTGKPIPAALVARMLKAKEFGKGVHVMRQMHYAALSLAYHDRDPNGMNLLDLLKTVQKKYSPYPYEPNTHAYCNFGHLQGYSSMYYTYMWSLVIAKDLFTRFEKEGLMNKKTALDFRRKILEPGGSVDAVDMVKAFLGRPHTFAAYQAWLQKK